MRILSIPLLFLAYLANLPANAAEMIVTNLSDIEFGDVSTGITRAVQRMEFCVAMNPAGPYRLTANGASANGKFVLQNPQSGAFRGVEIELRARTGRGRGGGRGARGRQLLPGVATPGFRARPLRRGQCRRPFTQITVTIDKASLASAPQGRYSGRLFLTVSPE